MSAAQGVTELLRLWETGDPHAIGQLMEILYPELRRLAASRLRGQSSDATVSPTELLHETWIHLAESRTLHFEDRQRFFGAAAVMMRNVLIDRARARKAAKRGGEHTLTSLPVELPAATASGPDLDLEGIGRAIHALEKVCLRQARQVDLRFFAGFSANEAAEVLGISPATLKRDWVAARMFIREFIEAQR